MEKIIYSGHNDSRTLSASHEDKSYREGVKAARIASFCTPSSKRHKLSDLADTKATEKVEQMLPPTPEGVHTEFSYKFLLVEESNLDEMAELVKGFSNIFEVKSMLPDE